MTRADWGKLLLLGLLGGGVAFWVSRFQPAPGYMDADYYQAVGQRFVTGYGLTEPFLWNYLDDPAGLPHPAHAYWMPLTSLLAAAGMWLGRQVSFSAARMGFVLLAALLPPLTALTALWFHGRRPLAWAAGALAAFSAFYAPFLPTTDAFGLYMLWGLLFVWAAGAQAPRRSAALGLLVALMHLTRADGILWLPVALWAAVRDARSWKGRAWRVGGVLLGYGLVMLPWFVRNSLFFGAPLAPGGVRALFVRTYNDLFLYPASQLTWSYWLSGGLGEILQARLWAARLNLGTLFAVQGGIIWLPFILWVAWQRRKDVRVQVTALGWTFTFLFLTLVFPFAGARGAFFHSGAAVQPFFWVLAPLGLQESARKLAVWRGWKEKEFASRVLLLFLLATLGLTVLLVQTRVAAGWGREQQTYRQAEAWLQSRGALDEPIIVANPPGYWLATGRTALALPGGGPEMVLRVADDFGAAYLLLQADNHPPALQALFASSEAEGRIRYLATFNQEARLYVILSP